MVVKKNNNTPLYIPQAEVLRRTLFASVIHLNLEDITIASSLLSPDTTYRDMEGTTPLHLAAVHGNIEAVKALISSGSLVNVANGIGWSPLHFAILGGFEEVVELLLAYGAWPAFRDNMLVTPLHILVTRAACYDKMATLVCLLLNASATCLEAQDQNGHTPLMVAAYTGNVVAVQVLLECGANKDAADKKSLRPGDFFLPSTTDAQRKAVGRLLGRKWRATTSKNKTNVTTTTTISSSSSSGAVPNSHNGSSVGGGNVADRAVNGDVQLSARSSWVYRLKNFAAGRSNKRGGWKGGVGNDRLEKGGAGGGSDIDTSRGTSSEGVGLGSGKSGSPHSLAVGFSGVSLTAGEVH